MVSPIEDNDAIRVAEKNLSFRVTWVEAEANAWHQAMHVNSLSSWYGGKAWDQVEQWEEEGLAKVLASTTIGSRSGQRVKVSLAEVLNFRETFPPPGATTAERHSKSKSREVGHILEMDPIIGESGIIYFNYHAVSTSTHGWSVSYRRKESEKWVPEVQFPKFYTSTAASNVTLGKASDLLIGVGTQPLENGQPNAKRKWLVFVHNDSYDRK